MPGKRNTLVWIRPLAVFDGQFASLDSHAPRAAFIHSLPELRILLAAFVYWLVRRLRRRGA
jgi:hypothetical protein